MIIYFKTTYFELSVASTMSSSPIELLVTDRHLSLGAERRKYSCDARSDPSFRKLSVWHG